MTLPLYGDLATLKAMLSITDTQRDTLLTDALTTSSRWVDGYCDRRFYLDATASTRVYEPADRSMSGTSLVVDDIGDPSFTVSQGNATDGWTDITTDVEARPLNSLARGYPITSLQRVDYAVWQTTRDGRIQVTARWGWPAVPDEINQAALIQAARLYRRKDSPEGVLGSSEWGVTRVSRVDPDVVALLAPYMAHGFA